MSNASGRMAIGSIFGAVTALAQTASGILDSINDGAKVINMSISDAARRQEVTSEQDMVLFEATYAVETRRKFQEAQEEMDTWLDAKDGRRSNFLKNCEVFDKALEDYRNRKSA